MRRRTLARRSAGEIESPEAREERLAAESTAAILSRDEGVYYVTGVDSQRSFSLSSGLKPGDEIRISSAGSPLAGGHKVSVYGAKLPTGISPGKSALFSYGKNGWERNT